ncbi:TonB-dependent receptor [Caulobacter sp. SLTY]|uniref:TonB-dependent receptor n=1 Tax=Caulobacter sp. SLTY TaxID=2683262 RepID=UPI001411EBC4|nr:TonB-dependent receptor [Caulobacter sp. SLTY]NBB14669.1 TonB-dependent receptor [Caulobacter sp. SLTY]
MTPSYRRLLLAAAGLSAMICATTVQAQEAPATDVVEEVIVTAQKREQAAVDVPMSLTAYSGDRLESLGVEDFNDLSLFTPGLEVQDQSPNNPGFVVRGITSDDTSSFAEARVSVFQDGVSISKAQGSYVELFDLERVEVAKGPQSTLYGRGALIGAINVIQAKANPAGFDAALKVTGGDFGLMQLDGMINQSFGEVFAIRLSGRWRERDGYVDNLLGGEDFQSVNSAAWRLGMAYEPNDAFRADLLVNWQEDRAAGTAFKSLRYNQTDPTTGALLDGTGVRDGAALAAPAGFIGGPLGVDRTVQGATALVSWDFSESFTFNSITAYREFDSQESFDADGLSLPLLTGLNDAQNEQFSQEFRVNFDNGGRFKAFAGLSYFKESSDNFIPLQFDERVGIALLAGQLNAGAAGSGLPADTPAPLAFFGNTAFTGALVQGVVASVSGGNTLLSNTQAQAIATNLRSNHVEAVSTTSDLEAWDFFVDGTFEITPKFEISVGLRYTMDDKETGFGSATIGGRSVLGGTIGAAQLSGQAGQLSAQATQLTTQGNALIATGVPANVTQGNALLAQAATLNGQATALNGQASAIFGALASPFVQAIPESLLPNFGLTFQPTPNNGDLYKVSHEDKSFTWRLVGRYAVSDDINLYASYARGRLPEVLAVGAPGTPGMPPRFDALAAETVDSYEVGAKAALLDGRLRLDGAIYFYDYKNFQTVEQQGTVFVITNAGAADAYGFEGSLDWRVVPGLNLLATYGYSHARFSEGAYEGNSFRLSPDHTFSLAASWSFDALGGTFNIRPSYTWQSEVFFEDDNDRAVFQQPPAAFVADNIQDERQDAYGLVNLRASYKPDGTNVTVEVFATNLTDEDYIIDAGNTGDSLGLPTFIPGAPRMVGASLGWKF